MRKENLSLNVLVRLLSLWKYKKLETPPYEFWDGGVRPAGRVSFPAMGKKPKDRRGRLTSPSETSSLRFQFVLPQSPVYGRYPYTFPQNFRRAKYGSGYDSSRATGPWCGAKFWPVPFYRRAWFRPAVAEGAGSGVCRLGLLRKQETAGRCPAPTAFS